MASAFLTVLYPTEFTIYDIRVCEFLPEFNGLAEKINFDRLWERYQDYIQAVKNITPSNLSLRERDRYLWGNSFSLQLESDLKKYEKIHQENQDNL